MNLSSNMRFPFMLIIVCILLAMPTACSESIPSPFKTPTPSPTSTPEGGLAASTVGQVGSRERVPGRYSTIGSNSPQTARNHQVRSG